MRLAAMLVTGSFVEAREQPAPGGVDLDENGRATDGSHREALLADGDALGARGFVRA
jgi:hypothetical protein